VKKNVTTEDEESQKFSCRLFNNKGEEITSITSQLTSKDTFLFLYKENIMTLEDIKKN
jgi:hypothetical protein